MGVWLRGTATVAAATAVLVLTPAAQVATAAFPGASGKLAFERIVKGHVHVMLANARGTSMRQLHLPAKLGTAKLDETVVPHWSGDGKRILFETVTHRHVLNGMYVVNANGSGLKAVAAWHLIRKTARWQDQFSWNAAGKRLYWLAHAAHGRYTIESATLAGKKVRKILSLTSSEINSDAPFGAVVSPNGKWVAFVADNPSGTPAACPDPALFPASGLYVVSAKGGTPRLVATNALAIAPDWSGDGSRLVYTGERPDPSDPTEECLQGIDTVGASGSGQQLVWEYLPSTVYQPIGSDPVTPVFSPDGRRIAFRALYWKQDASGDYGPLDEIFIVNADGTGIHALTNPWNGNPVFDDYSPSWQPLHG